MKVFGYAAISGIVCQLLLITMISPASAGLTDGLRDRLSLHDFSIAAVTAPAEFPEEFIVSVPLDGVERVLVVEKRSLRAVDYQAWEVGPGGRKPIAAPPVATYRGFVADEPDSVVALNLRPEGIEALVLSNAGPDWYIQPLAPLDAAADPTLHVVYRATDIAPTEAMCGTDIPSDYAQRYDVSTADLSDPSLLDGSCQRQFRIALDADVEYYNLNGSSTAATISDMEAVMNGVEAIYARDVRMVIQIGDTFVRSAEPDAFQSSGGSELLEELKNFWNTEYSTLNRGMVQLFTGRDIAGSTIGIAYLATACNRTNGYSAVQSRWSSNFALRVSVSAHEIGHMWSAGHCNGQPDCSIMCASVGGCGSGFSDFGQIDSRQILFYSESASCLTLEPPFPTPLPPRAIFDAAVVTLVGPIIVDVLANDIDGNCNALTISAFDASTPAGATVARVAGGGPGGRDVLRYTAAPGFSGQDRFNYTVSDGTGRTDVSFVNVTVSVRRPADFPTGTLPGVEAHYYVVPPTIDRLPNFSTLTPYLSEVVADINYPSSPGTFAGSGRAENVAAVFRGYIRTTTSAIFTFYTQSDDGSKLFIGDTLVVDNDGLHGFEERSGQIGLDIGRHPIRVEFFERGGNAGLIVSYQAAGVPRTVIQPFNWKRDGILADTNCDGTVDFLDIESFVTALSSRLAYENGLPLCDWWNADVNGDFSVNFVDIDAFVQALVTGGQGPK